VEYPQFPQISPPPPLGLGSSSSIAAAVLKARDCALRPHNNPGKLRPLHPGSSPSQFLLSLSQFLNPLYIFPIWQVDSQFLLLSSLSILPQGIRTLLFHFRLVQVEVKNIEDNQEKVNAHLFT
jgi:hypothetical protein